MSDNNDKVPLFYTGPTKPIKIPKKLLNQNRKTLKSVDDFRKEIEENDRVAEDGKYVAQGSLNLEKKMRKQLKLNGPDKEPPCFGCTISGGKTQKRRKHKRATQKRKKARKTKRSKK